jgi:hypothetical protein
MKLLNKTIPVILLLIFTACNSDKQQSGLITVDIEKVVEQSVSNLYMSEIFADINFIQLQTGNDIMIGNNPEISVVQNFIIVNDGDNCFLFNKEDGAFIRKIGAKGRGPNEFRSSRGGFINSINKRIFFLGLQGSLLEYDFEGRFHRDIPMPGYSNTNSNPSQSDNLTSYGNEIIAYIMNPIGIQDKLLLIYTVDSEIVNVHNNSNILPEKSYVITFEESQFYHYRNQLFFKEIYNDTIYLVTDEHLLPHMVLHTGDYLVPYEFKWGIQRSFSTLIGILDLIETSSHLFFRFSYNNDYFLGCFDKTTEKLSVSDWDSGIMDDIQNFIPFIPLKALNDDEVMGYTDAWKVVQWFKDNPEKAAQLPPHLKKLESLTESDNPVVMIARYKE